MKRKVKYLTGGSKICLGCKNIFFKKPKDSYTQWFSRKCCSIKCMARWMETRSGEETNHWNGDKVGYWGIHIWLKNQYGKANKCESKDCRGRSKIFEWAKIREKEYARRRKNFWQLCRSCHRSYDFAEKIKNELP